MENEMVFRFLLLLLLVSFVGNRAYYTRKSGRPQEDSINERDNGTKAALVANLLSILALISTLVYLVYPQWMLWASLPLPEWVRWLGVGAALLGFTILQWAHHALGKNWSDQPRLLNDQTLITVGPYHWIRHPIYTAFLFIMVAIFLISANWFIGLSWILATLIEVGSRIKYEEAIMIEQFGSQYLNYREKTGALFPFLYLL